MNKTENKQKEDILKKAKKIVSIDGWSSEIFSKLQKQNPGKGGEFHITDAIQSLINDKEKFIAHSFLGKYLDCGSMHGYIKSSMEIAKS